MNIISQHISVKRKMTDQDYGNMDKMLLSISTLCSLPLHRPRAACAKLRTNYRRSAFFTLHFTFHIPQFHILPTAIVGYFWKFA